MHTTRRRKKWGKKLVWVKKRGAKCLAAILSAGMLVSQMSIGAMAADQKHHPTAHEVEGEKYTFDENGVLIN